MLSFSIASAQFSSGSGYAPGLHLSVAYAALHVTAAWWQRGFLCQRYLCSAGWMWSQPSAVHQPLQRLPPAACWRPSCTAKRDGYLCVSCSLGCSMVSKSGCRPASYAMRSTAGLPPPSRRRSLCHSAPQLTRRLCLPCKVCAGVLGPPGWQGRRAPRSCQLRRGRLVSGAPCSSVCRARPRAARLVRLVPHRVMAMASSSTGSRAMALLAARMTHVGHAGHLCSESLSRRGMLQAGLLQL